MQFQMPCCWKYIVGVQFQKHAPFVEEMNSCTELNEFGDMSISN